MSRHEQQCLSLYVHLGFVTVSSAGRKLQLRKQEVSYIVPEVTLKDKHDRLWWRHREFAVEFGNIYVPAPQDDNH